MVQFDFRGEGLSGGKLRQEISNRLHRAPANAVVRIRIHGSLREEAISSIRAEAIRSVAPPRMNVEVRWVDAPGMPGFNRLKKGD